MKPYPLLLEPIFKSKVWGGRRLERLGKSLPDDALIGESWELADLAATSADGGGGDAAHSRVARGEMRGLSIAEAIRAMGVNLMGALALSDQGGFPLLVKFLDAREDLSVQVHPSTEFAAANKGAHLKTESWYVLDAEPGAVIYKGLRPGVTREGLAKSVKSGKVVADLIAHPAKPGDFHHLPSGTLHALGAGVLVAEVQTPSDTTFRVYDWGRTGRALHLEQALECIDFSGSCEAAANSAGAREKRLVETPFYSITERNLSASEKSAIESDPAPRDGGGPMVWMVVRGQLRVKSDRAEFAEQTLVAGDTVLFPAAMNSAQCIVERETTLLEVRFPAQPRP